MGELSVDINRDFTMVAKIEYFNYTTETENPAWNLPELQGSLFLDYQINDHWYTGANLFYVGERNDLSTTVQPNMPDNVISGTTIALDGFFDANMHLGYRLNDQLSLFAKASNLANNTYQQWANFRVQGFQALAGATYKFDF